MKNRLKSWLPKPEELLNNRWLRWLGPALRHPRLWHFSRKGIAMGMALGIFFGLLIPVAQIPFSAATAVLLRANLPMAVASTLVTNPVTFGPVYYGAYHLGKAVLGERPLTDEQAMQVVLGPTPQHGGKTAGGRAGHRGLCKRPARVFSGEWSMDPEDTLEQKQATAPEGHEGRKTAAPSGTMSTGAARPLMNGVVGRYRNT
ncbi:MAG: DUF2062 domain-containing protein [Hydrogenophaga sp.]|nr:DUF2062 domain-containing protein [Hydrogenophaga sp.]